MKSVDDFRGERYSPASALFRFRLKDPRYPGGIHVFVEGHADSSFYINFVHRFCPDPNKIHIYECQDKKGVYETHRSVMGGLRNGTPLFFVDKDLSDILNETWEKASNIYVTDYYAIENYLVSLEMLARVWMDLLHFNNIIFDFDSKHREAFQNALMCFHQYMLSIMAWTIYLRRSGSRPNVKNIRFERFFYLNSNLVLERSEEVVKIGEIKLLERTCGVETPEGWSTEAPHIMAELKALDPKTYVRGKLELCFFVKFVQKLRDMLNICARQTDGCSVGMKTQLTDENAVEILGPRLTTIPSSLDTFMRENLSISA